MSRRNGRIGALSRFARWQIASRLLGARTALPFVGSAVLLADTGITAATGNFYYGLMEPGEMGFLLHVLRPDDLFVDIGANVGSYTVLASKVVGAKTIAVEASPDTYRRLRQNIAVNSIGDRVSALPECVSDRLGSIRFSAGLDVLNHVLADDEDVAAIDVPARTLDAICAGATPVVMKIDVEGHERPVLTGGSATLSTASLKAVIMETNGLGAQFGSSDADLFAIMTGHGFDAYRYDPFGRQFMPAKGGANTIFLRDLEWVQQRCRSAPSFRIGGDSV